MGAPLADTTIANRCRSQDTYERRVVAGTLPQVGRVCGRETRALVPAAANDDAALACKTRSFGDIGGPRPTLQPRAVTGAPRHLDD